MATVLITGSNGQLGSDIKDIHNQYNPLNFIFTDVAQLDITNVPQLKLFFNNHKIDYIVNCAAYTAVDKAETDRRNAEILNIIAVSNLSKLATNFKIKLFHISTDYVFDGNSLTPYVETDKINPVSVYGYTKYKGEIEAQRHPSSIIIRTSWLYSTFGQNFVKNMLRLTNDREEIGVVNDQVGNPTYAQDLAHTILHIILKTEENHSFFKPGIYHYSNEGECTWYDLTCEIVNYAGLKCKINPIATSDYPTPAKRPAYSVFNKQKIINTFQIEIPQWKDSLHKCLNKMK
jgi:dTDP-4-dehydrorhamnose reductase